MGKGHVRKTIARQVSAWRQLTFFLSFAHVPSIFAWINIGIQHSLFLSMRTFRGQELKKCATGL